MNETGLSAAEAVWGPMAADGHRRLEAYSTEELATVLRFLAEARQVQLDHLD